MSESKEYNTARNYYEFRYKELKDLIRDKVEELNSLMEQKNGIRKQYKDLTGEELY